MAATAAMLLVMASVVNAALAIRAEKRGNTRRLTQHAILSLALFVAALIVHH